MDVTHKKPHFLGIKCHCVINRAMSCEWCCWCLVNDAGAPWKQVIDVKDEYMPWILQFFIKTSGMSFKHLSAFVNEYNLFIYLKRKSIFDPNLLCSCIKWNKSILFLFLLLPWLNSILNLGYKFSVCFFDVFFSSSFLFLFILRNE